MKPNTTQLEILLFTNSSVSKKQLAEKNSDPSNNTLSPAEELQKQCWAVPLSELLPEIISSFDRNRNIYIWAIITENNFIRISMGAYPQQIASRTSLDPHFFLSEFLMN